MGIVIKKFNKNNTPQSVIEESMNIDESLGVNSGVRRQEIIIKREISDVELEKEIIIYMKILFFYIV